MHITTLPSGLVLAETPPEPPAAPPDPPAGIRCQTCGAAGPPVPEIYLGGILRTPAGTWHQHWWVCGHPKTWECPKCSAGPWGDPGRVYPSCPVCGEGCEYT